MRKRLRALWLAATAAVALGFLAEGAQAASMWAAIRDGGSTDFHHFSAGPGGPSTSMYPLNIAGPGGGGSVAPENLLGFQFLPDGSMWAVIRDGGSTDFHHFSAGPGGPSTSAFPLNIAGPGGGGSVAPENLLGFQFLPDGSMWAVIRDGGSTDFHYFSAGPGGPSTSAFPLNIAGPGGGGSVAPEDLLAFQFLADGSLWAAIADDNSTDFHYFSAGPGGPSTSVFSLNIAGPGGNGQVAPEDLLGFQFLEDGSMWAVIRDGGSTDFHHFSSGPGGPSTSTFPLNLAGLGGNAPVAPGDLRGFDFVEQSGSGIGGGSEGGGTPVPEPATLALLGAALLGLAGRHRRPAA